MFLHGVGEQEKCTFRGSGSKCSLSGVIVGWGAVGGHVLGGCCGLWGALLTHSRLGSKTCGSNLRLDS